MRLTLTQFVTLDGVYQGPGSPDEDPSDGFTAAGGWCPMDQTFIAQAAAWLAEADALLLGRRTYEAFADAWPHITDPDDPFTERMNGLPKYVASHTLTDATWSPSTILRGDIAAEVAQLKARPGRELQLHGSARLAQTLLAAGLIDEVRLVVTPTVLGQGRRLFPSGRPSRRHARHPQQHDTRRPHDPRPADHEPARVRTYDGVSSDGVSHMHRT